VASVGDLLDRQLELIVDEKFNQGLTPNLIPLLADGHPDLGLNHGFKWYAAGVLVVGSRSVASLYADDRFLEVDGVS
jgi:hypothetical protein